MRARCAALTGRPASAATDIWRALFKACELFTAVSKLTVEALGLAIDDEYDRRVTAFLRYTHDLPRDAETLDFTAD